MSAFDVTPDGSRFLVVRSRSAERGREEMHVVLHWFDNLRDTR
jgi:hypothetical protein